MRQASIGEKTCLNAYLLHAFWILPPPERAHAYENFPWANIKVRTYGHPVFKNFLSPKLPLLSMWGGLGPPCQFLVVGSNTAAVKLDLRMTYGMVSWVYQKHTVNFN